MGQKKQLLQSPLFVISVLALLLNDFFLKQYFHNFITGKLSDFAGLFAFTLFLLAFSPGKEKCILVSVSLFFVFWKSSFSQPVIDAWNSILLFPVFRTIDYSDLIALPFVWLAYRYSLAERRTVLKEYLTVPFGAVAFFAFCATSYIPVYDIDKNFEIGLPKEEVVVRLNDICKSCENFIPLSSHTERADTSFVDGNSDTVYYSIKGYRHYNDTMWHYDNSGRKVSIDTVRHYKYADKDTMYLSPTGFFVLYFDVREYLQLSPEKYCGCIEVKCRMTGYGNKTKLYLITANAHSCSYIISGRKTKEEIINAFQKDVLDHMK